MHTRLVGEVLNPSSLPAAVAAWETPPTSGKCRKVLIISALCPQRGMRTRLAEEALIPPSLPAAVAAGDTPPTIRKAPGGTYNQRTLPAALDAHQTRVGGLELALPPSSSCDRRQVTYHQESARRCL
ncbi:hypothetical protein NDU88_008433 [Pleurodeles waltl]|uniref:Uncharacterized protein n=1 Tax=Pleurodeles waltl TaxID=8319 RepID=A0AAV7RWU9_PLEWA|nr:hypothetical protein NDU88_008433 [Pleurodeles waltl]